MYIIITVTPQRLVECAKQELNLVYLELNWEDVLSYNIREDDLVKCVRFIHQARNSGGSVLVHCAHVSMHAVNCCSMFTLTQK